MWPLGRASSQGEKAIRRRFEFEAVVPGPPERVFTLLCPVREKDWIPGWSAKTVHSRSGFAELGAIFRTRLEFGELWVTTRYEPNQHVEYTIFAGHHAVVTLDLYLASRGDGTCRWSIVRTYTGIDWLGRRRVRALTEVGVRAEHELLARRLEHFVTTGRMLTGGGQRLAETRGGSGPSSA